MTEDDWRGPRPGRIDLKEAGIGPREACLTVSDDAEVWRTPDGNTFASMIVRGHKEHHAIQGRPFRDWLLSEVAARYSVNDRPASVSENIVRDVRQSLEARAYTECIAHSAPLRVAWHDGSIFIDTGWPSWEAFEICADGWGLIPCAPVPIIRSRRTGGMVTPAGRGDLSLFRMLLRDLREPEFVLLVAWCLMALWPRGPYPIGMLTGEQGSGKSTKARLVQRLVDPVTGDLLQPPANDRDLIAAARQGRILAFDNMSGLKPDLADSICRLSTGAEIGGRALYTDWDTASFATCQPVFCNGIPELAVRSDLADRSVAIRLAPIENRLSESEFWAMAAEALPGALAGLFDALVLGLQTFDQTSTPNVRMADFAKLVMAAEPRLPWRQGAFIEAYIGNRANLSAAMLDGDAVAQRILAFAERTGNWSGLASQLYRLVSQDMSPEERRASEWPTNANWFGSRLTRVAPALREMGVNVTSRHSRQGTTVTIAKMSSPSSPNIETVDPPASSDDHIGDNEVEHPDFSSHHLALLSPSPPRNPPFSAQSDKRDDISTDSNQWLGIGTLTADDLAFIEEWANQ